jgi:four helix bundle protein
MKREPNVLLEKSDAFSDRIVKMYQYLKNQKKEDVMSKQVLRSGTSIGANLTESKNAQSTPDYLSKQNIALKEADETLYWLKKLYDGGYLREKEYTSINNDCTELVKMLVASVKTLKKKLGRLEPQN